MTTKLKTIIIAVFILLSAGAIFWIEDSKKQAAPSTSGWQTTTDDSQDVTFKYPQELGTSYIFPVDWPPEVIVMNVPFSCNPAGKETERAGETKLEKINGREYCVTRITEGAAGSIYTQYAYAFPKDKGERILVFSLRKVQCGNYDEPKKSECEKEQGSFDIGEIVDGIASTL